jgi:hypothetical protein
VIRESKSSCQVLCSARNPPGSPWKTSLCLSPKRSRQLQAHTCPTRKVCSNGLDFSTFISRDPYIRRVQEAGDPSNRIALIAVYNVDHSQTQLHNKAETQSREHHTSAWTDLNQHHNKNNLHIPFTQKTSLLGCEHHGVHGYRLSQITKKEHIQTSRQTQFTPLTETAHPANDRSLVTCDPLGT